MTALFTAVIALIGIYIAFSLFTSWANEQIATLIGLRSKTLVAGLRAMIGEAATTEVFGHPLISSLGERVAQSTRALAKLEPLCSKFTAGVVGVRYADVTVPAADSGAPAVRLTPYIPSPLFATVITDIVRAYGNASQASASASKLGAAWSDLVAGLDGLGANPAFAPLQRSLTPIWRQAQGDYDAFVSAVADWYDSHMDRVTGWYKRSAQRILLWIAVVVVLAFNLDTLQMWNGFQGNVNLSNAVAGLTQGYANAHAADIAAGKPVNLAAAPLPTQDCLEGAGASPCTCPPGYIAKPEQKASSNQAGDCVADVSVLTQLPVGWSSVYRGPYAPGVKRADFWKNALLKIVGWAVTIAALMLGAPFWFDLLRSVVNVRSAGPAPQPASTSSST